MVNNKRIFSLVLALTLIVSVLGTAVAAEQSYKISAQEAIEIAKANFSIPAEMNDLQTRYHEGEARTGWELTWRSKENNVGEISIAIDADTKEIVTYRYYNPNDYQDSKDNGYIPKLTWEEARDTAVDTVLKLTKLAKEDLYIHTPRRMPLREGIKYYDVGISQDVDGVPYHGNKISVSINADNGEIRSYYCEWEYDLDFPQDVNVTLEEAQEVFTQDYGLALEYRRFAGSEDLQLVYAAQNPDKFILDADSGEIISRNTYYGYGEEQAKNTADSARIEPYEQQELDKIADLLNKEEALVQARVLVSVPAKFTLDRATLQKQYDGEEYLWSFSFTYREDNEERQETTKHGNINVSISAVDGSLHQYSKSWYDADEPKVKPLDYAVSSRREAVDVATEFIGTYQPELLSQVELLEDVNDVIVTAFKDIPSRYYLSYARKVNGAYYKQDGIRITVDARTGEVIRFSLDWSDQEFTSAEGVMSVATLSEQYLQDNPIALEYIKYRTEAGEEEIRLVYSVNQNVPFYDAFDGTALRYDGKEIIDTDVEYTDIQDHWAKADILLLQRFGLLPFTEKSLQPDKAILQGEFIEILRRIGQSDVYLPEPRVLKQFAQREGLLLEEADEWNHESTLVREDMAQMLTNKLGYEDVAKLNIYQLNYSDAASVSDHRRGAVAICSGLQLMGGNNAYFAPQAETTRAEAISVIARFLR